MHAKIFLICVVAVVLPYSTHASYAPCTTAEDCKSNMKSEANLRYSQAFSNYLTQSVNALEAAVKKVAAGTQDATKKTQLEQIESSVEEQRKVLEELDTLTGEKMVAVYHKTDDNWRQLRQLNEENIDIKAELEHVKAETENLYKAAFYIWTQAGILRNGFEIDGFEALDRDVQKAKDTPITDENMEFIIGTYTRVVEFLELKKYNVFTE